MGDGLDRREEASSIRGRSPGWPCSPLDRVALHIRGAIHELDVADHDINQSRNFSHGSASSSKEHGPVCFALSVISKRASAAASRLQLKMLQDVVHTALPVENPPCLLR